MVAPGAIRRQPPRYAANGREILAEFSLSEIDRLAAAGVLVEQRRR